MKLKDFLNSASSKFSVPQSNEYNLLYINWSYCDFASNSFLEAWSLLTNRIMFTGTQCDLWGRPDGTGHEKGLLQNRITKDARAKGLSLTFCPRVCLYELLFCENCKAFGSRQS